MLAFVFLCLARPPLLGDAVPPDPLALYLHAIAQVESGDNPAKIGRQGERTRWQIRQTEWEHWSTRDFNQADDAEGRRVAASLLSSRIHAFELRHQRAPTPPEIYLLWHRPARVLSASPAEKERAERFANLFELAARRAGGSEVATRQ